MSVLLLFVVAMVPLHHPSKEAFSCDVCVASGLVISLFVFRPPVVTLRKILLGGDRQTDRQRQRNREGANSNSNSKTLFYKKTSKLLMGKY